MVNPRAVCASRGLGYRIIRGSGALARPGQAESTGKNYTLKDTG